jgi:hypothetical protein
MYFILGRLSADIIKVGGEKVSALEVEREMLSLPAISECAVVGLPSETWGQKVAAVVVLSDEGKTAGKDGKHFGPMDLRRGLKDKMAAFKIPQELKVVESIPRNAMGKSKFLLHKCCRRSLLICSACSQQEAVGHSSLQTLILAYNGIARRLLDTIRIYIICQVVVKDFETDQKVTCTTDEEESQMHPACV